jgi:hypothetical protein
MSQHVPDVNLAAIEVNGGNQSVLVTTNVENDPIFHLIG